MVLVKWHVAVAYCRWFGRRLPTVDELQSTCEAGRLKKRGDIWEWTATDVETGGQPFKALCGPANSCACSHRYHPDWKNEVKGFLCVGDAPAFNVFSAAMGGGDFLVALRVVRAPGLRRL